MKDSGSKTLSGDTRDQAALLEELAALRRERENYRRLLDCGALATAVHQNGVFVYINEKLASLIGVPDPLELVGAPINDVIVNADLNKIQARINLMERAQEPACFQDEHLKHVNGEKINVEITAFSVHHEDAPAIQIVVKDISGRKAVEANLKDSEQRFRQMAENMDEVFWLALPGHTGMLYVSPAFAKIWGRKAEDLVDNPMLWRESLHPDDRLRILDAVRLRQLSGTFDETYRILRPNGEVRWVRERAYPVRDERGRIFRVTGIVSDVSSTRDIEERNRALLQSIPDLIFVYNREGILSDCQGPEELMLATPEEQKGRNMRDFLPQDVADRVMGATAQALDQKELQQVEYSLIFDEEERHFEARLVPLNDRNVLGLVRDVTTRIEEQRKRRQLEARLRHAQKLETIGTLAGGIAHDFNNMLSPIMGFTEMALNDLDDTQEIYGYLENVLKASRRAKKLIQQILVFSHAETEQSPEPMNLGETVQESYQLLRASFPATIQLHARMDTQQDVIVGDATQIHQVVVNLCANARQAIGEKNGNIIIRLERMSLTKDNLPLHPNLYEGCWLRLSVEDDGHGMDETTLSRIFEPFFTTKDAGHGTGLGLSVIHGIVRGHKGAVEVWSELGQGTRFDVYLPAYEGAAIRHPQSRGPSRGKEAIIFVDDEEMVTEMGVQMLTNMGYDVTPCLSGRQALELYQAFPEKWDLVITDQIMPGLSGLELAEELHKLAPDLPVLLATGFSEGLDPKKIQKSGVDYIIYKPYNLTEITSAIRNSLSK